MMKNKLILFFSLWMMSGLYAMGDPISPVLDFGWYPLLNHCCGNAGAGEYGFRADGVDSFDPHTFSMNPSDGASVMLHILNLDSDPTTAQIEISGTMVSNQNTKPDGVTPITYNISMVYDMVMLDPLNGEWFAVDGNGTGTLTNNFTTEFWTLTGYPIIGEVLRIGFNHRDQEGISLRGWVAVDGYKGDTQDWLAHPVPEPATLLLLGTALLGGAAFRKRLK